jgi:holliday junction DNA helicase RuvA
MFYTLSGEITHKSANFVVLETGGVGFKIFTNNETFKKLPPVGGAAKFFIYFHMKEDGIGLFGFPDEESLKLFEMLNAVAGVGPKTALGVLDIDNVPSIMAAIIEKRADLLTRASGIGQKTAERIILELQNKMKLPESQTLSRKMDMSLEVEEILISLGYQRNKIRQVVQHLEEKTLEENLRTALKALSKI